jgi:hypothetical protein
LLHSKSVLYGAFVWARRALTGAKRRHPARAGHAARHLRAHGQPEGGRRR